MDNKGDSELLFEGARALGLDLSAACVEGLLRFREELLKWNQRVNLTSIDDPREVLEKHFLDSLAILPEVREARSLLDVGAGGGFPGIPLKLALPALEVTLVDTVAKKVAFMKSAVARLGLAGGARAIHARAEGAPEKEGLPRAELAVSRAFKDPAGWVPLAARYLVDGGRVISMFGQAVGEEGLRSAGESVGLKLLSVRSYQLPWSRADRGVAVFGRG